MYTDSISKRYIKTVDNENWNRYQAIIQQKSVDSYHFFLICVSRFNCTDHNLKWNLVEFWFSPMFWSYCGYDVHVNHIPYQYVSTSWTSKANACENSQLVSPKYNAKFLQSDQFESCGNFRFKVHFHDAFRCEKNSLFFFQLNIEANNFLKLKPIQKKLSIFARIKWDLILKKIITFF